MNFPFYGLPDGVSLRELISAQGGDGPSATKLQYILAGRAGVICASLMTYGGILVYCWTGKADGAYWLASTSLWTAVISFSSWTKMSQAKQTKEIVLANGPTTPGSTTAPKPEPADLIPSGD